LKKNDVFVDVISEKLGHVTGKNGTKLKVDDTFTTKMSVLYDSFYIVGGDVQSQGSFEQALTSWVHEAYRHYKPIGIATTGKTYIHSGKNNNLAGVVFAENNPQFTHEFIKAIAKQRFWKRT